MSFYKTVSAFNMNYSHILSKLKETTFSKLRQIFTNFFYEFSSILHLLMLKKSLLKNLSRCDPIGCFVIKHIPLWGCSCGFLNKKKSNIFFRVRKMGFFPIWTKKIIFDQLNSCNYQNDINERLLSDIPVCRGDAERCLMSKLYKKTF